MKIAIIGFGNMGKFFFETLKDKHEVYIYDSDNSKYNNLNKENTLSCIESLKEIDLNLLINAVPLTKTIEVFKSILPNISESCVICDIASVKGDLKDFYKTLKNPFVSMHPMFGPTFGQLKKLESENAVLIKESELNSLLFFKDFFEKLEVRVFSYTFEEHDKMMAYSLSLPFISSFVFSACTTDTTVPGTTFKKHEKIAKGLLSEDHHLLSEILFNPYTVEQLRLVSGKMEHLKHIINGKDYEESIKFIGHLENNLKNNQVKESKDFVEPVKATEGVTKLSPYLPGKTIEEVAKKHNLSTKNMIKLASNENPLGAPKEVKELIKESIDKISLYPDGSSKDLKEKISEKFSVKPENIIIGNGSSEIIENVCMTFMKEKSNGLFSEYAFGLYKKAILASNHSYIEVPADNLGHSLNNFLSAINKYTKVIFIANPNNPTGTFLTYDELNEFIKKVPKNILIVLDEAYIEYTEVSPMKGGLEIFKNHKYNNLLILRTFSKVYGLAGFRVGYGFGHKSVIEALDKVRTPTNITTLAGIAAKKALDCEDHVKKSIELNKIEKEFLIKNLENTQFQPVKSSGNFILIKTNGNGKEITENLEKKEIIVRPMGSYDLPEYIRVTVGTRKENEIFLKALLN